MSPFVIALMFVILLTAVGSAALVAGGAGHRRLMHRARRLGARSQDRMAGAPLRLRRDNPGGLDVLAGRILPRPAALRQRLAASGSKLTIGGYLAICGIVALVATGLAIMQKFAFPAAVLMGLFAGLLLPHLFVGSRVAARRKKFSKLFPDAIGLMVRGLKAGLPASESILVVGRELADPVGEEFRRVGDQVRLGQPLEQALWAVAKRLQLPEFNFLVITFSIQRETGGNLAETLQNLDSMLRARSQMKLKIKAMSSEAMATAAIIGCLPFVMGALLFFVSHNYIMTLVTTDMGHVLLAGAAFWLSVGFFIMSQMVKFEI